MRRLMLSDVMETLPTLRMLRTINADFLRVVLGRESRECTWCGSTLKGRQRAWCSPECIEAFKIRTDNAHQRSSVWDRECGICQLCNRDINKSMEEFEEIDRSLNLEWHDPRRKCEMEERGHARGHWWEVDHVTPVCEGGGLCDMDGLRLLCGACHLIETNALTKRRKERTKAFQRPKWVWKDCDRCDGAFFTVDVMAKNWIRLSCQTCDEKKNISAADFDVLLMSGKNAKGVVHE